MKHIQHYLTSVLPASILLALCVSLVLPVTAGAQERVGLSISPPTFEFSANPGDSVSNSIRVENITDEALPVSVDVRNFSALGEEGQVNLTKEESAYALASWIKVTPGTGTIPAKESITFEYTIDVPLNAEPGGKFGSIVFQTTPKQVESGTGVAVGQEVGALVFLKIAGEVTEKASIESFTTSNKLYEYGPVTFEARVKNAGNVQFKPRGTITITNMFGKSVQTIPIDSRNVLPDAIRKMNGEWKNKWILGPHTATLSLVYGSKGQIITASTSFWGLPYKIVGAALIVLLLIGFVMVRGRRRLSKSFRVLFGKD